MHLTLTPLMVLALRRPRPEPRTLRPMLVPQWYRSLRARG